MIKQFFAAATIVTALASIQTEAGFTLTDWKVEGDKKAVLDETTGLEWLKISETHTKSFNFVLSNLDELYAGWRLPTYNEVVFLVNNHFDHDFRTGGMSETKSNLSKDFFDAFGRVLWEQTYQQMYVFYKDEDSNLRYLNFARSHSTGYMNSQFNVLYNNPDASGWWTSTFLVNDGGVTLSSINNPMLNIKNPNAPINQGGPAADVVSPAGLAAAGALLMFLGARRRKLRGK